MRKLLPVLLLVLASPLAAQERPPQGPKPQPGRYTYAPKPAQGADMFGKYLFPPELIMQRQQAIGLTDAQRDQIRGEIQKVQSTLTDVQWRLAGQGEAMEKLLQAPTIDESRVLAQVDSVLSLERQIKRAQIGLLVRIHNVLTEQQREKLQQDRQTPD